MVKTHKNRGKKHSINKKEFELHKFNLNHELTIDSPKKFSKNRFLVYVGNIFGLEKKNILGFFRKNKLDELFNSSLRFCFLFFNQNKQEILLGRDFSGAHPLFYAFEDDFLVVASEKHELLLNNFSDVHRVDPGSMVSLNRDKMSVSRKEMSVIKKEDRYFNRLNHLSKKFVSRFKKSIKKRTNDIEKGAVAFSGGVDSSFLSKMLSEYIDVKLFTIGLEGSPDLEWSGKASSILNLPHKKIVLDFDEIKELIEPTLRVVADANRLKIGVGLPFYKLSSVVVNEGYNVLFSGQGSDELFLGYDKYRRRGNPKKEILMDLEKMAEENIERDEAVCMENSVEIRNPYLDKEIIDFALGLPYEINLPEKRVVREAAKNVLPEKIWKREKKSVQYGTRIDREIDRIARKNGFKRRIGNHVDKYLSSVAEDVFPKKVLHEVSDYIDH